MHISIAEISIEKYQLDSVEVASMARPIDKKPMHDKHQLGTRAAAQLADIIRRHATSTLITLFITN